jgi:acyl-CoA synthetase (AMP-forming)/AMP-acid ligase II
VRGGANVYPAEVERVIRLHPAVTEAAVFGVPDERLGEKVAALVSWEPRSPPVTWKNCADSTWPGTRSP